MYALLAFAALVLEAAFGYPDALYRRIGHPVTWLGALIACCDHRWNAHAGTPTSRRLRGLAALVVLVVVAGFAGWAVARFVELVVPSWAGLLLTAGAASSLIAQRSLDEHVRVVAEAIERDGLEAGRHAVSKIVGRDTATLDAAGVSRAAIESLAENFSDAVVAPVFWLTLAGLPGCLAYKAINTADSMIGHKDARYRAFGWAAARSDDLLNLPASRLAALWLVLAAGFVSRERATRAAKTVVRDAARHRSPNAGWPEAALAGALGLQLAGPRTYGGELVDDAFMGDGRAAAGPSDIRAALTLYRRACALQAAVLALVALLVTR
jgi:adenosylcobinamide-phosphate synthase